MSGVLISIHLASVGSALTTLQNTMKGWGLPLAAVGIVLGGLLWMISGSMGNTRAGALGIKIAAVCIAGVAIVFGATDLAHLGQTFHL